MYLLCSESQNTTINEFIFLCPVADYLSKIEVWAQIFEMDKQHVLM